MNNIAFVRYTKFLVVMVFLVIIAGGVVRMTQSGMGCPDWPKCFGMWVPPTNANQLPADFEKYLKQQDIDHTFNVYHTWIEYLNRLLGALLGIFILIHTIWAFRKFYSTYKKIFWWSFALLIAVAFQAWLGKKVVDANLAVVKITIHMLGALVIAAIPVYIIHLVQAKQKIVNKPIKLWCTIALVLLLLQIILGTEVREQIDEISKLLNYQQRDLWIDRLDIWFKIHRTFSLVITGFLVLIFIKSKSETRLLKAAAFNVFLVVVLIALGIIMNYANIPALAQPMHLLASAILAVSLFNFRLKLL